MVKLLLIEDEKILRENTSELLEVHGFICITAADGKEGLEKALIEKPDLIICDIMLPNLNGLQVKEELNNHEDHALTPIIFLSAKGERDDLRQGMDSGAADYITKPFKITELLSSVERRLKQAKTIEAAVHAKVIECLTDFIQIAKHECNTPLNGIINLSDILVNEPERSPGFAEKALRAINCSGKRLSKTLNNLIDLVRLRHYTAPVTFSGNSTDVTNILGKTISERVLRYHFSEEIKASINFPHQLHLLQEDVEIMIFEVIDNLFKFSAQGSVCIDLHTKTDNRNFMMLTVSNSLSAPVTFNETDIGPFKQFNRAKNEQQGSGLGLYLVKVIVENYQGTLVIDTADALTFRVIICLPFYGM